MASGGTPINRQWVIVLKNGCTVIDWGDDIYQDVMSGDFLKVKESDVSHHILNHELEILVKAGRVASYDSLVVKINSLPERTQRTFE